MITVGRLTLAKRALLAPMAGITDLPFRRIATGFGAALAPSEMVASGELLTDRAATLARAEVDRSSGAAAVQIAGREAAPMAEAARRAEAAGADLIDINMGCPAKKVTSGLSGSALMRDPDHALSLIDAVVGAVNTPVTLKMRLGWDDATINAPDIARRAEAAGITMITVHGRTRNQFYKGEADWRAVAAVKQAVDVPVIVNGDITDSDTARRALALSGADGVMIGRGAQGAPWTPGAIGAALAGEVPPPPPSGAALLDLIVVHYEAILSFYGVDLGVRIARKHLSWYLGRLRGGAALRARLMLMKDHGDVIAALRCDLSEAENAAVEDAAADHKAVRRAA
ncbi:MAG: tRNA dihydrouridine synthase DusB [Pseudomonadota bacterium]